MNLKKMIRCAKQPAQTSSDNDDSVSAREWAGLLQLLEESIEPDMLKISEPICAQGGSLKIFGKQ